MLKAEAKEILFCKSSLSFKLQSYIKAKSISTKVYCRPYFKIQSSYCHSSK